MGFLLEAEGLVVRYGPVEAVSGVSLGVSEGEVVAVLGRNGAGKSSLLKAISGAVRPAVGRVSLGGRDLTGLGPRKVARAGVSYAPEGRRIFPGLSVRQNLLLGAANGRAGGAKQRKELLQEVLDTFPDLQGRQRALAWTLSGGQQQMVAIGRALMARPRVLLLDEPSLGLAPGVALRVLESLERIRSGGSTIVLVEQNVSVALRVASRGYVLELGKVVLQGDAEELRGDEGVLRAYLGVTGRRSKDAAP